VPDDDSSPALRAALVIPAGPITSSFPQALPLRHSRKPLAGIHVGLGFRAAAGQGQGGFPITPLGNDGAVTRE